MQQSLFPDLVYEQPEPALTFRGDDGVWVLAHNTLDVLNRFWRLAHHHVFNVCRAEHVLFIYQGRKPNKVPKNFLPTFDVFQPRVMHTGLVVTIADVCDACRYRRDCLGPGSMSPVLKKTKLEKNNITLLAESINCGGVIDCPLFRHQETDKATIAPRDLRAVGFEPIVSPRAFTESGDTDCVRALKDVDLSNFEAVNLVMGCGWCDGVISDGWRRGGSRFEDLSFDRDAIAANRLRARIRGLHARQSKSKIRAFRRTKCERCLYDCERPPWCLEGEPLTHAWVMDNHADYDREWLELFTVMGHRGRFLDPDTGCANMGIGCWPNADGTVKVVRLRPGYSEIDNHMAMDEYLRRVVEHDERKRDMEPHGLVLDHEHLTFLNWALHALLKILHSRNVRFHVDGRSKRNDILYLGVTNGMIEVGSDTLAGDDGGFGRRGERIETWDRPRFLTHYVHPYAESIRCWLGMTPGGC